MEIRRINNGEIFYFGNDVIPKYSFNAKELDEETGMYYFEARYYRAPTFISRDPLFEKFPSISPYAYCANNPVKYVDPSGETVEPAGEEEANAYKNYKTTISDRISYWQSRVEQKQASVDKAKTGFGRAIKSIGLNNAKNNLSTYKGIQNELNEMENSSTVFRIRMGDNIQAFLPSDAGGSTTYNTKTGEVDINIGTNTMDVFAHEFLHGYQFEKGELSFSSNGLYGGVLYDLLDEKAAYDRGALFGGNSYNMETLKSMYPNISNRTENRTLNSTRNIRYEVIRNHDIRRY